jgi:hypothetical protein
MGITIIEGGYAFSPFLDVIQETCLPNGAQSYNKDNHLSISRVND